MVLIKQAVFLAGVAALTSCNAYAEPVNGPESQPAFVSSARRAGATVTMQEPKVENSPRFTDRDSSDLATRESGFQGFIQDAGRFVTQFIRRDINEREVAELAARDPNFNSFMKGVGGLLGNLVRREEPAMIHARSEKIDEEPASRSSIVSEIDDKIEYKDNHHQHSHTTQKVLHHDDHGDFPEHEGYHPHKAHRGHQHHSEHSKLSEHEGHRTGGHHSHKAYGHQYGGKPGRISEQDRHRYVDYHKALDSKHHGEPSEIAGHDGHHHMQGHHSHKTHGYKHHGENEKFSENKDHQPHKAHGHKHYGEHEKSSKHKAHKGKHSHKSHSSHKHLSEGGEIPRHKHSMYGHEPHHHSKRPGSSKAHSSSSKHHKSHKHNNSFPKLKFPDNVEMVHYKSEPHEMIRFHPRDAAPARHGIHETSQQEWAQHEHQKAQEDLVRHGEAHMGGGRHGSGGAAAHHPAMGAMPQMGMHQHAAAMGPRDLESLVR